MKHGQGDRLACGENMLRTQYGGGMEFDISRFVQMGPRVSGNRNERLRQEVFSEFSNGKTQSEIARQHGLSRQRVHSLVKEMLLKHVNGDKST